MSWVCDFCSTCNEEKTLECFVCGQPRSAESIREGKERLKAERFVRFNKFIFDVVYSKLKIVFASSIAVASVVTIVWLIIKITHGNLDDIPIAIEHMAKRIGGNIQFCFGICVPFVFRYISHVPWKNLSLCFEAIMDKWALSFASISTIVSYLNIHAKKQSISSYNYCVKPLGINAGDNIVVLWDTIVSLWNRARYTVEQCIDLLTGYAKNIASHF